MKVSKLQIQFDGVANIFKLMYRKKYNIKQGNLFTKQCAYKYEKIV